MKLIALLLSVATTGCVQTQFTKSMVVTRDADGKIISTTESESMTQPGSAWPVKFEYLKAGPTGPNTPARSPADTR